MKKKPARLRAVIAISLVALALLAGLGIWLFRKPSRATLPVAGLASTTAVAIATTTAAIPSALQTPLRQYIEIIDGCGPYYDTGTCVNMRSGPDISYPVVDRLRTGVVLEVASTTVQDKSGRAWYKIVPDKEIRYPERVTSDWYVAANPDLIQPFENVGDQNVTRETPATKKRIIVSVSKETLYAYNGDTLFMQEPISTGLEFTPTPMGKFSVYKKTPSRYMQGPLPGVSSQKYDLPGVPWDLYFSYGGSVIHGAYWHNHFGEPWSHGCVNLSPDNAKKLYLWTDIGTSVMVEE